MTRFKNKDLKNNELYIALKQLQNKRSYDTFDRFIISKMGFEVTGKVDDALRRQAYKNFYSLIADQNISSRPTTKKWFGINGFAIPKRYQIYRIAFALQLSIEDLQEWLTKGILEPGICYNDYSETIFCYGLENSLSYEECCKMIEKFEQSILDGPSFMHTHSTNQIASEFRMYKKIDKDSFMQWMITNAAWFKGYSMTTWDYINTYKKLIIEYIRQDTNKQLNSLLIETDFLSWLHRKRAFTSKKRSKLIQKYCLAYKKKQSSVENDVILQTIMELNHIVASDFGSNRMFLSELFGNNHAIEQLPHMSEKYLSDLLNQPFQKEKEIMIHLALRELYSCKENESCPNHIEKLIEEYSHKELQDHSVENAKKQLEILRKEQKRRCLYVKRSDILPMIHYVAQRRYMDMITPTLNYNMSEARKQFIESANAILLSCGMVKLDPDKYWLDAVFLACFQKSEMYYYSDALEILEMDSEKKEE